MSATPADVSTYRWSRAALFRPVGLAAVILGGLWVGIAILSAKLGASPILGGIAAAVTSVALATGSWILLRPPRVLELSSAGYRTWHLRGGGVSSADWSDVQSVDTRGSAHEAVIMVVLTGGRTSIVPVVLLGSRAVEAQREMHARLNTAFGYRRLSEATG